LAALGLHPGQAFEVFADPVVANRDHGDVVVLEEGDGDQFVLYDHFVRPAQRFDEFEAFLEGDDGFHAFVGFNQLVGADADYQSVAQFTRASDHVEVTDVQ
jgi:hypothetical protein